MGHNSKCDGFIGHNCAPGQGHMSYYVIHLSPVTQHRPGCDTQQHPHDHGHGDIWALSRHRRLGRHFLYLS